MGCVNLYHQPHVILMDWKWIFAHSHRDCHRILFNLVCSYATIPILSLLASYHFHLLYVKLGVSIFIERLELLRKSYIYRVSEQLKRWLLRGFRLNYNWRPLLLKSYFILTFHPNRKVISPRAWLIRWVSGILSTVKLFLPIVIKLWN